MPCVEVWQTCNLRPLRLVEEKKIEERRKKLQGKNIMAPLLHRAAIIKLQVALPEASKVEKVFVKP